MKKNISIIKDKAGIYISALLLPMVILLTAMFVQNVFPMGNNSVLLWDLEIQYIDLFAWFRNVLHNGEGLFYSFSKSLGGNMFGLYSLYLTSPLNLLIYFFEVEELPAFFSLLTILKLSIASLTTSIFIKKRFNIKNNVLIVVCSSAFALTEYNIAFCSNIHFLDAIYMLPLVALGVWELVNYNKKKLLYISIAYVIVCNWYIGYMVCLFSVFDFIFEYYLSMQKWKFKEFMKKGLSYCVNMCFSVLTSAVFFLPAALAAMNGKGSLSLEKLIPDFHIDPLYPLRALFITSPTNTEHGLPAIYVSYFILILCILFLFNKKIDKKVRCAVTSFLIFLFISFSFVPLEIIWTDFKETYSFHHRYAFVFSFLMVLCACFLIKEFEKSKELLCLKEVVLVMTGIWGMFVVQDLTKNMATTKQIILTFIIMCLYAFIIICGSQKNISKKKSYFLCGMLLIVFCFEQCYNVSDTFSRYNITLDEYSEYAESMKSAIEEIEEAEDKVFYRTEKTFSEMSDRRDDKEPAASEAFVYEYKGITHYSSTYDTTVNDFLTKLGYCKQDAMATNYVDSNFLGDSLLGVKYVLSEKKPAGFGHVSSSLQSTGKSIYKNDYSLDFGTVCEGEIKDFKWGNNPFENVENMFNTLLGEDNEFYVQFTPELTEEETVSWNIDITQSGPVYAYFNSGHADVEIYVNGEYKQTYFGRFYKNIFYLGDFEKGEVVNISLKDSKDKDYDYQLLAMGLDEELTKTKLLEVKENEFSPEIVKGNFVRGYYECNEPRDLLLQVPYDEGWDIYVNGEKISYEKAFDGLTKIEVPNGKNLIEMRYTPPGFLVGVICTLLGILGFVFYNYITKKYKRFI